MKRRIISADRAALQSKRKTVDSMPVIVPMPQLPDTFGPSRSWYYREAKLGNIRLVKIGRSTYGDSASILARIAALKSVSDAA